MILIVAEHKYFCAILYTNQLFILRDRHNIMLLHFLSLERFKVIDIIGLKSMFLAIFNYLTYYYIGTSYITF